MKASFRQSLGSFKQLCNKANFLTTNEYYLRYTNQIVFNLIDIYWIQWEGQLQGNIQAVEQLGQFCDLRLSDQALPDMLTKLHTHSSDDKQRIQRGGGTRAHSYENTLYLCSPLTSPLLTDYLEGEKKNKGQIYVFKGG